MSTSSRLSESGQKSSTSGTPSLSESVSSTRTINDGSFSYSVGDCSESSHAEIASSVKAMAAIGVNIRITHPPVFVLQHMQSTILLNANHVEVGMNKSSRNNMLRNGKKSAVQAIVVAHMSFYAIFAKISQKCVLTTLPRYYIFSASTHSFIAGLRRFVFNHIQQHAPDQHAVRSLSGNVLVLNQSYQPISICNVKKAVILLLLSKAELIAEHENRAIRSMTQTFSFPSVIRLFQYVRAPFRTVEPTRKNIHRRDEHRCQYCGTGKATLTIDHVFPKSRGGEDTWENLVCACIKCNNRKGNRTPNEAHMPLMRTPRRPSLVMLLRLHQRNLDERWKPFLFM